ncbi:MAG TPA: VWA domain-containing protein [Vicinamibacterales bacterium]|nr:VWA domain-containing protein [Vicinamibacterales bacterium]
MKTLVFVILCAAGTTGVFCQDNPATFKGGIDLVALNVVVVDPRQQFVSGLTAGNFAIYEDGVQQDVSFFAAAEIPLDLAILLDTSSSMHAKLATAQEAAVGFVAALRPVDRLLVMDIKDSARVLSPLSHDLDTAISAIRGTSAAGNTAIYNGLYLTLKEMARQKQPGRNVRRQALVLLSDGDDTTSLVAYDDVMALARQTGISIYTIMLRSSQFDSDSARRNAQASKSEYGMKALAQETGGRSFLALQINDLAGVYKAIGEELASQYAIGYMPTNQRRDGAYRRVNVRIVDRANAQPRTRAGYLAPRG